jgi:hypothetical protein
MELSPSWEANRPAFSREILRIMWDTKVHYCVHKRLPPVLILSQINLAHASPSHFLKIYFNIILPSTPASSKCSLFLRSHQQKSISSVPLTSLYYTVGMCSPNPYLLRIWYVFTKPLSLAVFHFTVINNICVTAHILHAAWAGSRVNT